MIREHRAREAPPIDTDVAPAIMSGLAQSPVPMAFKDELSRYLSINAPAREIFRELGAAGDIIGRTDVDIFGTDMARSRMAEDRRVMAEGHPVRKELTVGHGDRQRSFQIVKYPVRNGPGRPIGVGLVAQDITPRRSAERETLIALEEANHYRDKLQAVFEALPEGVIAFDHRLRVTDFNPSMRGLCEVTRALQAGEPWPDGEGRCDGKCVNVARHVLDSGRPVVEFRVQCRTPSGRGQAMIVNATPFSQSVGDMPGVLLTVRDVTRQEDRQAVTRGPTRYRGMIGCSDSMQRLYAMLERLADLDTTVLVLGESGTGKELIVEAIHEAGVRRHKPLVKVNCAALSEPLLESELFGHVRGAFTGAARDKLGRFELADGGSIFLDEIGDIPPATQVKLLRFLESKEFERVGDSATRRVDVRVMAATNADLREKVRRNEFRADLYYRLRVMVVELPPLRERPEDIPLLLEHFASTFRQTMNSAVLGLSDEAMRCLQGYHWPGNVRELKHAMESAFVVCDGNLVNVAHLPHEIRATGTAPAAPGGDRDGAGAARGAQDERERILRTLEATHWNKRETAKRLGMARKTLYRKLERYGIS